MTSRLTLWIAVLAVAGCDSAQLLECGDDGFFYATSGAGYCIFCDHNLERCPEGTHLVGGPFAFRVCGTRTTDVPTDLQNEVHHFCDRMALGDRHSCVVRQDDLTVWCWGADDLDQLGRGDSLIMAPAPSATGDIGDPVTSVGSGYNHSCALNVYGDLWCWGDHRYGQLGDPMPVEHPVPFHSDPDATFVAMGGGERFTCGLKAYQEIYCWGEGPSGELGAGDLTTTDAAVVPVTREDGDPLEEVHILAVGGTFACAAAGDDNGVWCWGDNAQLQLGQPEAVRMSPFALPIDRTPPPSALDLAAGARHVCALIHEGTDGVVCWGDNGAGQLGRSASGPAAPMPVPNLPGRIRSIAAGAEHSCALADSGMIYCWGANEHGQLGHPNPDDGEPRPLMIPPEGTAPLEVAAGGRHTCARYRGTLVTAAETFWCWGNNVDGQVTGSTGDMSDQPDPTRVPLPAL